MHGVFGVFLIDFLDSLEISSCGNIHYVVLVINKCNAWEVIPHYGGGNCQLNYVKFNQTRILEISWK